MPDKEKFERIAVELDDLATDVDELEEVSKRTADRHARGRSDRVTLESPLTVCDVGCG